MAKTENSQKKFVVTNDTINEGTLISKNIFCLRSFKKSRKIFEDPTRFDKQEFLGGDKTPTYARVSPRDLPQLHV